MATKHPERDAVQLLSVLRLVLGLGTIVAPGVLARLTGNRATAGTRFMGRIFATREIALALVTLDVLADDDIPATVLDANMLVDGLDGVAGLVAGRDLPTLARLVTIAGAAGAVATVGALRSRVT